MTSRVPTIFHITHWKAGSQWVAAILKHVSPDRFVPWKIVDPHALQGYGLPSFYRDPIAPGSIYGTVYLTREEFQKTVSGRFWRTKDGTFFYPRRVLGNWWNYRIRQSPYRSFVVIRDLRDTLLSLYFSAKHSHPLIVDRLTQIRNVLTNSSEEDGLIYLLSDVLPEFARIQASWVGAQEVLLLRYENILDDEYTFFQQLTDYCQIDVTRKRLEAIVRYNLFAAATGRQRGTEDVNAHLRKGIVGDWRNHFTERVKAEFKKQYGTLLIDTGYEKNLNW